MNNRTTVLVVVLGFCAVLSAVLLRGYGRPHSAPGTAQATPGAIGAANDIRSGQPVGNDAAITDQQLQALRQSDLFRRMQANPEVRKVMQAGLAHVLSTGDLAPLANLGDALGHVVSDPGFVELSSRPQFTQLLSQGQFQHLAGSLASRPEPVSQSPAMGTMGGTAKTPVSGRNPGSVPLAQNPELTKEIGANGLSGSPEMTELMQAPEFQRLIGSHEFQQLAQMPELGRAMANTTMQSLIRLPEFGRILLNADVRKFLSTPEVVAASKRPEFERSFMEAGD